MTRIVALFNTLVMIFTCIFSGLGKPVYQTDFSIKAYSDSSWNGDSVYVSGEIIDVTHNATAVTGSNIPKFEFEDSMTLKFKSWVTAFNYYGIMYTSDSTLICEITYLSGVKKVSEKFFLDESEKPSSFYSFTDSFRNGKNITELKFTSADSEKATLTLYGISTFMKEKPTDTIYIENEFYKIGTDMVDGGALSFLECKDKNIQAVKLDDDTIKIGENAQEKYGGQLMSENVNLINRYDTGRLVQQSYYGTNGIDDSYECGVYGEDIWPYNPVQGGNQYNIPSKIIDYSISENSIYIKCRPMDWAKTEPSDSYMEATLTLDGDILRTDNVFTDYSGYNHTSRHQELPAFYTLEPLNIFAYGSGGEIKYEDNLDFWAGRSDQIYKSDENWGAFLCERNGFGIGIFTPGIEDIYAGVYERDGEAYITGDISMAVPTSYIAPLATMKIKSYKPLKYTYFIKAGNISEISEAFNNELKDFSNNELLNY